MEGWPGRLAADDTARRLSPGIESNVSSILPSEPTKNNPFAASGATIFDDRSVWRIVENPITALVDRATHAAARSARSIPTRPRPRPGGRLHPGPGDSLHPPPPGCNHVAPPFDVDGLHGATVSPVTPVLSIVLAGGEGKRLMPLTLDRAKPAVPFGGQYRLIDFVLSNLANAGLLRIVVLTQYKSHSLDLHISRTWRMSTLLGDYVSPVPAQMRRGPRWFSGFGRCRVPESQYHRAMRDPSISASLAPITSTGWTLVTCSSSILRPGRA